MSIRVFIADDQEMVRVGFGLILAAEKDIEVVGEAADGAAAIEGIGRLRPDVALLDIRMPLLDGLEVTARVAGSTAVVVVTTFGDDTYVVWGLPDGSPVAIGTFDVVTSEMDLRTVGSAETGLDEYPAYGISIEPGRQAPSAPTDIVATGQVTS